MIHYHGMPVSGSRRESARFLMGRHALVSFADPSWLDMVAECCASFILDNGAFTTWKQGKKYDYEDYVEWVGTWHCHPGFDWALIPDSIDGDEEENDRLLERWPLDEWEGVPVWHLHESLDRLHRLSAAWPRIALGSSGKWPTPNTHGWWERMAEAMDTCCSPDGLPYCRLHGLRMLDPDVFTRLPFASADSANAAINAGSLRRFGQYAPPSPGDRAAVIALRIEAYNSAPVWVNNQEQLCDISAYI